MHVILLKKFFQCLNLVKNGGIAKKIQYPQRYKNNDEKILWSGKGNAVS